MKKNIILIIEFIILVLVISLSVYAAQSRTIESGAVSYGDTTVKDKLDDLFIDTNQILEGGDAKTSEVYPGKIGYSKGTLIKGAMADYGESAFTIENIFKVDDNNVGFHPTEEGYYSPITTFTMTFGNQKTVTITSDGYLTKTTTISVPSSLIYMGITLKGNNINVKNTNNEAISSETIEYGKTKNIKVGPKTGYYISGASCTNGYTINASTGTSAISEQTVTITNPSSTSDTECTFSTSRRGFAITMTGSNVTFSENSASIEYGLTKNITINPAYGYYIESVSCTNGYTTNANTGTAYYESQTITISNNGNLNGSTCTVKMHSRNYTAATTDATYHPAETVTVHTHGSGCYSNVTTYCYGGDYWDSSGNNPYAICKSCGKERYQHPVANGSTKKLTCTKATTQTIAAYYSCASGSSLSGSKCYSCPNGGTLSGTTCVF